MNENSIKKMLGIVFAAIGGFFITIGLVILQMLFIGGKGNNTWVIGLGILLLGAPFAGVGLGFIYTLRKRYRMEDLLEVEGIRKKAVVVDYKVSSFWVNGIPLWKLVVETDNGEQYESEAFKKPILEAKYPIGTTVEVLLHRTDSNIYTVLIWADDL